MTLLWISRVSGVMRVGWALACWVGAGGCGGWAQDATPVRALNIPIAASRDGIAPVPTLHVYTNLAQIPTLVLTPWHERMKPVAASRFRVSLDAGPLFQPTHVRMEDEDPLSLAVLIDDTVAQSELLPVIEDAIAGLAAVSLRPQDRVSIYVMDCSLIRAAESMPADSAQLRAAVSEAMMPWRLRRLALQGKEHGAKKEGIECRPSLPLWDSLANVTQELFRQPGRRVLLAVTDGKDDGSRMTWKQVEERTQLASVAIFGVLTPGKVGLRVRGSHNGMTEITRVAGTEDPFDMICQLSGGVEVSASKKSLGKKLQDLTSMVRQRYILEFPRGNNMTAGYYTIEVSILKSDAYIRTTGIILPAADPKVLADPMTLPSNPALAPELGTRRVVRPPLN